MDDVMKLLVNFIKFLLNLKIDIRKSEIVCGFLPFGFLSSILLPEQIIFFKYVIYAYSVFFVIFFIIKVMKFVVNNPRWKKYENIHIVELQDLAMKLHYDLPANPFRIVDKRNFLAGVTSSNRILFGKYFLNNLSSDEKIFVGGHEFFHIYGRAEHYMLVAIIPIILLAYALLTLHTDFLLVAIICIGSLFVSVALSKRSIEHLADLHGAEYSGKGAAISALTKGYATKKHTFFDFHPRLQIRIRKIEEHFSKTSLS